MQNLVLKLAYNKPVFHANVIGKSVFAANPTY